MLFVSGCDAQNSLKGRMNLFVRIYKRAKLQTSTLQKINQQWAAIADSLLV